MPAPTIIDLPAHEQESLLRELRHGRFGYGLGIHILLLCAARRTPTEIAAFLFCSRSSVYRAVEAYRRGEFSCGWAQEELQPVKVRRLPLERWLLSLLKQAPRVLGWCRTRWSCATLVLELEIQRHYSTSRETVRRTLHPLGYAWKSARPCGRDDDPERVPRRARIRHLLETLPKKAAFFFADELDIHLLPKIGYEWMLKGTQKEIDTPGTNEKSYLAGALDPGRASFGMSLEKGKTAGSSSACWRKSGKPARLRALTKSTWWRTTSRSIKPKRSRPAQRT